MRKGHNIITTMPWIYLELNGIQLRIDSEDSSKIYSWREYKTKPDDWFKRKPTIHINKKTGYKTVRIVFNEKCYLVSRVIYKAHNPEWDITDTSDTNLVDHINVNSTDNRIENLRIVSRQQNMWNKTNTKGYYWNKPHNQWVSSIRVNKNFIHLGCFTEEADARQAYLTAKEKYHIMPI